MRFKYNTTIGITLVDPMELKPSAYVYSLIAPLKFKGYTELAVYVRASDVDGYRIRFLNQYHRPVGELYCIGDAEGKAGGPIVYMPDKIPRK